MTDTKSLIRTATVKLTGLSPFSPSRAFDPDVEGRGDNETADDHEKRIWRHRIHHEADGTCFIPSMMIQLMLQYMAKRIGAKIPGKRNATYTKHFESGIAVPSDARIEGSDWQKVPGQWLHLNADGVRGGGKRVWRCMPMIMPWSVTTEIVLLDPEIPEDLFERTLVGGGAFCGFGRFSPRRGGTNGRFRADKIEWS